MKIDETKSGGSRNSVAQNGWKARRVALVLALVVPTACASAPPPEAVSSPAAAPSAAVKPDAGTAKTHLADHVKYPATRAEILAACADTKEFTEGQKKWFSDNLPEGIYQSAADVAKALAL